jgi:hypothetical protein
MKRDILILKRIKDISYCCPGHDDWPVEKYASALSRRARSRDKAKEHRYVRRILNARVRKEESWVG